MPHNKSYGQRRRQSRREHMHQVNLLLARLIGTQNITTATLKRGFFGRLKWLVLGY